VGRGIITMRKLHLNNPQNLTIEDLNKIKRETPYNPDFAFRDF
jgi:hypothetical protein